MKKKIGSFTREYIEPIKPITRAEINEFKRTYKPELTPDGKPYAPDGWEGAWPPIPLTAEESEALRKKTSDEQKAFMKSLGLPTYDDWLKFNE